MDIQVKIEGIKITEIITEFNRWVFSNPPNTEDLGGIVMALNIIEKIGATMEKIPNVATSADPLVTTAAAPSDEHDNQHKKKKTYRHNPVKPKTQIPIGIVDMVLSLIKPGEEVTSRELFDRAIPAGITQFKNHGSLAQCLKKYVKKGRVERRHNEANRVLWRLPGQKKDLTETHEGGVTGTKNPHTPRASMTPPDWDTLHRSEDYPDRRLSPWVVSARESEIWCHLVKDLRNYETHCRGCQKRITTKNEGVVCDVV